MPRINCKVELKLGWTIHYVLSVLSAANANNNASANFNIIFTIKHTKLYVPAVTLSVKNNQKLSKFLSKGFKKLM